MERAYGLDSHEQPIRRGPLDLRLSERQQILTVERVNSEKLHRISSFQSNSFLVGLAWSILCIWPSHLILCALMNLPMSAPSINLSISMLFRIPCILSLLTGPNFSFVFAFQKCVGGFFFIFCC